MLRAGQIQVVAVLLAIALAFGASRVVPQINAGRAELNMIGAEALPQNTPPQYAFAIQAFGAFRGILTNIAFIRAEELKRQGRYYDAMQLHRWICQLQPRFPSVWAYASWNMAWNISVTTHTPEERWNWVYNGVKLLRDEGLKYNPRAVGLYRQLAWIYNNKMSESTDEYHLDYKREWAWRMHLVLGHPADPLQQYGPRLIEAAEESRDFSARMGDDELTRAARIEADRLRGDLENAAPTDIEGLLKNLRGEVESDTQKREALTDYYLVKKAARDRIQAIAEAPATLDELYVANPGARAMVQKLRDQLGIAITDDELSEDVYWREGGLAFTFFARYRKLVDPPSVATGISKTPELSADEAAERLFDEIVGVTSKDADGAALVRFLQRKVLREVYKLYPQRMVELIEVFGPLDWRLVDAPALYYLNEGLIAGGETINKIGNDKTNAMRIVFFSLRNMFNRGKLVFEPYPPRISESYINFGPDVNFIEPMHQAYITYGPLLDTDVVEGGTGKTYKSGHVNFLSEAIRSLYLADRMREAQYYYDYLRRTYGTKGDGTPEERYMKPLRDFVIDDMQEGITGLREAIRTISLNLESGYGRLANGDRSGFYRRHELAKRIYDGYMADKLGPLSMKMRLPEFQALRVDNLRFWLEMPGYVQELTTEKSVLWRNLRALGADDLLLPLYDDLAPQLAAECIRWNYDFDRAFPPPPGLEAYRADRKTRRPVDAADDSPVETPAQGVN